MDNVIANLNEAIAGIKVEEQKLLAEHLSKINIYNTELSSKVMEATLKNLSKLKNWQESIEQTKQAIINSKKETVTTPMVTENITLDITQEKNNNLKPTTTIITTEDLQTKLRTLAQHRFLYSTIFLMTDIRWSKDMFGLEYPFAKIYSDELELTEQVQDEDGEVRYWQEVFPLGEKKFLITNQWTEESRRKFAIWYRNITQRNNEPSPNITENQTSNVFESVKKDACPQSDDFNKKLTGITLLGKKYAIDFWSEIFTKVCEIMVLRKPYLAAKFDQIKVLNLTQVNFSYQENEIKTERKKLSNGMWIEVSRAAKENLELAIKVLEFCGYSKEDISLEY